MSCEHCRQFPHNPRCPMADEPPMVHLCDWCKGEIREGDEFYRIIHENVCAECIEDSRMTAEFEEPDWED